jgi:hypothetical protein
LRRTLAEILPNGLLRLIGDGNHLPAHLDDVNAKDYSGRTPLREAGEGPQRCGTITAD